MRPLDIDLASRSRAPRWAGWLLLALVGGFTADIGSDYLALREDIARIESRLTGAGAGGQARNSARKVNAEEFAQARAVIARFAAPWSTLFDAVEAVKLDEVSLLAIEPDPAAGSVTISAEGRDYLAVLTYVAQLQAQPGLTRVHLGRHELRASEPRRPVAFSVSAQWRRP